MITNFFSKKILIVAFLLTIGVTSAYTVSETTLIPLIFTGTSTTSSVTPTDETTTPPDTFTSGSVSFSSGTVTFSSATVIPSSLSVVSSATFTSGSVSVSSNIATTSSIITTTTDTFKAFTVFNIEPVTFTAMGISSGLVPEPVLTTTSITPFSFQVTGTVSSLTSVPVVTTSSVSPFTFTTTGTSLRPDQQVVSDNEPEFIFDADEEKVELIISSSDTTLTKITITDQTGEPKINFENILQTESDGKKSATYPNQLDIDVSTADLSVSISSPPDIKMTSSSSWDGVMNLPVFRENSSVDPGTGTVTSVILIGLDDEQIDFDKVVSIVFEDKAGEDIGFERMGVVTMITTVCNQDDQAAVELQLGGTGECKTTRGPHLVAYTFHYTKFFTSTSSSGGGGGPGAKPELLSLSFSNIESGILVDQLASFEVGEDVDIELSFYESSGLGMEHVEFYSNSGHDSILNSNFWVEYDRYKPLIVKDPNQFLMEEPQVRAINEGTQTDVSFRLKIGQTLPESDIIIRAWDSERNPIEIRFENVWKIIENTIPESEIVMDPEPVIDSEPSFSWEMFNNWAGYSTEEVTDSDFLSHLGYDGEKIPYWFKKNNAKWLKDELISQEDIVNAIEFLVEKGYTKI